MEKIVKNIYDQIEIFKSNNGQWPKYLILDQLSISDLKSTLAYHYDQKQTEYVFRGLIICTPVESLDEQIIRVA